MNPLVLLGLGAVAIIAMGKKKSTPPKEGSESEDEGVKQAVLQRPDVDLGKKKTVMAAMPPLDYAAQISQKAPLEAKQCHLQGMNSVDQIAVCIAQKIFPTWNWAVSNKYQPWQNDAMSRIKNAARIELGMEPIIT